MAAAAADGLHFRLFGAFEIHGPAGSSTLAGAKQRAIVSRLAIDAGRVVSGDHLVDAVWGDDPPPTVRASLQVHVSQIRKALAGIGAPDVLVTRSSGYELDVPNDAVDLLRFERLAADARAAHSAGAHERALDAAREALTLWIGAPLAGADGSPFVAAFSTRLDGSRLELIPVAASASISLGRAGEVLPMVESMIAEQPYAEPLWASAARLLYAQGRQADALDRLATVRRVLREELGLDPAPATSELEQQILTHDPSLLPGSPARRRTVGDSVRSKLPPMRSLVGRDDTVAEIRRVMGNANVVTLVGPGGVGKTSLATHVASAQSNRRDGVVFVDLTHVAAGQDPLPVLIAATGMVSAGEVSIDDLVQLLADRDQLLLIDNCEHVLDRAAELIERLAECPGVSIIATSREPLDVAGEVVIDVPALSPDDGVELFIRRARTGGDGLSLTPHELADVRRIVELLGGLPLALELASPMVRVLSPAQIVDELRNDRSPAAGRRARNERHSSMHSAVAWSYELLETHRRRVFERFSVFEGGTDLRGVLDVCSTDDAEPVIDTLAALVSRSLVVVDRTSSGMRYRMLVPIQAFARRKLEESGESHTVRLRHVEHVIEQLRANAAVIESADPAPGLAQLEVAAPNVRAAFTWSREHVGEALAAQVLTAMSLHAVRSLVTMPEVYGWIREFSTIDTLSVDTTARILAASSLYVVQPPDVAISHGRRAIELAQAAGDLHTEILATVGVAHAVGESDNARAAAVLTTALEQATRSGDDLLEGMVLDYLANHMLRAERLDEVGAMLAEQVSRGTRRFGVYECEVLYQCGRTALQRSDIDEAKRWYDDAAAAARRIGSPSGRSMALFGLSQLALVSGDLHTALSGFQECFELDRIVDPKERWSDSLFIAIIGFRLRDAGLVAPQVELLSETERPLVRAARCLAIACLAQLNEHREVANTHFLDACRRFATMQSRTHVRMAFEEWARFNEDRDFTSLLGELADGVATRRLSTLEAIDQIDARLASSQPS